MGISFLVTSSLNRTALGQTLDSSVNIHDWDMIYSNMLKQLNSLNISLCLGGAFSWTERMSLLNVRVMQTSISLGSELKSTQPFLLHLLGLSEI